MSSEIPYKPDYELQKKLRRRRALRDSWPLLIWMAVIAVAVWAYIAGGRFQRMSGYVSFNREYVAPLDDSRIEEIRFKEGEMVKEGEVLVQFDASIVQQERKAEIEALHLNRLESRRRLMSELSNLERERNRLLAEQTVDTLLESEFTEQLAELERLRESRVVTQREVNDKSTELAEVTARLGTYKGLIDQLDKDIAEARKLKEDMDQENVAPEDTEAAALALQQVESYTITAKRSGRISRVFRREGEVVRAGEPVLELQGADDVKTVTALLSEDNAYEISEGQTVYVASSDDRRHYQEARVISIAPDMMVVPDQASPIPNRMLRGRRLILDLSQDERLVPGQPVLIFLHEPTYLPLLGWLFE